MASMALTGTRKTTTGTRAVIASRASMRPTARVMAGTALVRYEDPLDADHADDVMVPATRRSLCRVALIASETATRFAREGLLHDPMAWLLAPRALFSGSTALEACLERDHCERAILLHGLSLGFDADPVAIDRLVAGDDNVGGDDGDGRARIVDHDGDGNRHDHGDREGRDDGDGLEEPFAALASFAPRRIFSATILMRRDGVEVIGFHASFARDHGEVFSRLHERFGGELTSHAEVRLGFDARHPLIPEEVRKLLLRAIAAGSNTGETLDVTFERRTLG
jgi:hypothetical protein